jgi:hypothetical protein
VQPREWLFYPIFGYNLPYPLHQFLTIGLLHHGLAFSPLIISCIYYMSSPIALSSLSKDLQNPPIIFDNHSITQSFDVSILFPGRVPVTLPGNSLLDFCSRAGLEANLHGVQSLMTMKSSEH